MDTHLHYSRDGHAFCQRCYLSILSIAITWGCTALAWGRAGHPTVSVNGTSLHSWSFDAMNVLTWAEEAGVSSAWLQFMALPSGPVFLGSLKTPDTPEDAGLPLHHTHI